MSSYIDTTAEWQPWVNIPSPAKAKKLLLESDGTGAMWVFAQFEDDTVSACKEDPYTKKWSDWQRLSGPCNLACVAVNDNGLIDVIINEFQDAVRVFRQTGMGANFTAIQSLGGGFIDVKICKNADGRLELFGRNDQVMAHAWQGQPGSGYGGWLNYPPNGALEFDVQLIRDGNIEISTIHGADRFMIRQGPGPYGWIPWQPLPRAYGHLPKLNTWHDGLQELFTRENDGTLLHSVQREGGHWSDFKPMPIDQVAGQFPMQQPQAFKNNAGQVMLFAYDSNQALTYAEQAPNGNRDTWTKLKTIGYSKGAAFALANNVFREVVLVQQDPTGTLRTTATKKGYDPSDDQSLGDLSENSAQQREQVNSLTNNVKGANFGTLTKQNYFSGTGLSKGDMSTERRGKIVDWISNISDEAEEFVEHLFNTAEKDATHFERMIDARIEHIKHHPPGPLKFVSKVEDLEHLVMGTVNHFKSSGFSNTSRAGSKTEEVINTLLGAAKQLTEHVPTKLFVDVTDDAKHLLNILSDLPDHTFQKLEEHLAPIDLGPMQQVLEKHYSNGPQKRDFLSSKEEDELQGFSVAVAVLQVATGVFDQLCLSFPLTLGLGLTAKAGAKANIEAKEELDASLGIDEGVGVSDPIIGGGGGAGGGIGDSTFVGLTSIGMSLTRMLIGPLLFFAQVIQAVFEQEIRKLRAKKHPFG